MRPPDGAPARHRIVLASMNRGPGDPRAYCKEASSLVRAGYEVAYVCNGTAAPAADERGVRVIGLSMPRSRIRRMTAGPGMTVRAAFELQPEAVHVFDPALIGPALRLGRKKHISVVVDLPEEYARQILQKRYLGPMIIRRIASAVFRVVSRVQLPQAALVVAATPAIAGTLSPRCRSIIVRNYAVLPEVDAVLPVSLPLPLSGPRSLRLVYVGGMSRIRGIADMVAAVGLLDGKAELHLAGPLYESRLLEEVSSLQGWQFCRYHGVLNWSSSIALVKACDVGVCMLSPAPNHVQALPVKVFEYMACSRPSIVSSFSLWRSLFAGSALFAAPDDPEGLARAVRVLLRTPELLRILGDHARRDAEVRYSWESEESRLVSGYAGLWGSL